MCICSLPAGVVASMNRQTEEHASTPSENLLIVPRPLSRAFTGTKMQFVAPLNSTIRAYPRRIHQTRATDRY